MRRKIEYAKAQVRAKVEHPFRVIKRQFGYTKVRFLGQAKKHRAAGNILCLVESVDGAKTVDGYGRGVPAMWANGLGKARLLEIIMS